MEISDTEHSCDSKEQSRLEPQLTSPKKLQKSIHNQLDVVHSHSPLCTTENEQPGHGLELSLRNMNLRPVVSDTLLRCRPYSKRITSLDLSYSIVDKLTISMLCAPLVNLEIFVASHCGLIDTSSETRWPSKLKVVNLSRNSLRQCPDGMTKLLYLHELNLSGNTITNVDPSLLRLPKLKKLLLLNNPVENIPKNICREGVDEMRRFFRVERLPDPPSQSLHQQDMETEHPIVFTRKRSLSSSKQGIDLRRFLLSQQGSFDSGYEPSLRLCSSTSSYNSSEIDFTESSDVEFETSRPSWPKFTPEQVPKGYQEVGSCHSCQVYLPDDCDVDIQVEIIKDISLHPSVKKNELLITPIVHIAPHGLIFQRDKPALIVLSHCTRVSSRYSEKLVALCSSTTPYQIPNWGNLEPQEQCGIFEDCVMFSTTHFSLFAVIASIPYPTSEVIIAPNEGANLTIPDLPGFELEIPQNCLNSSDGAIPIKATVYYGDPPYSIEDDNRELASACIGLEPHGMKFENPVRISIPIPHYRRIKEEFHDVQLQIWCSHVDNSARDTDIPHKWEQIEDIDVTVHDGPNGEQIATFMTTHFSWYEFLWSICKSSLQNLGLGAAHAYSQLTSRTRYVSVRCQAFISRPVIPNLTFGLLVAVYKFGEPLERLSNYPWPVADSGPKRIYLRIGQLCVSVEGCFTANRSLGEHSLTRERKIVDFTGEDFCERFEFALELKADVRFPLEDGQLLGKLCFTQWEGPTAICKTYNLVKQSEVFTACTQTSNPVTPTSVYQSTYMDVTPPWSPEPPNHDTYDEEEAHHDSHFTSINYQLLQDEPCLHSKDERSVLSGPTKRKRTSTSHTSSTSPAHIAKRRILIRNDTLTDKVLMSIAQSSGSKYTELGIELGVPFATIQNVVSCKVDAGKSDHMKAFYVLQEWKGRSACDFNYGTLCRALENVHLNTVAHQHCYVSEREVSLSED